MNFKYLGYLLGWLMVLFCICLAGQILQDKVSLHPASYSLKLHFFLDFRAPG